ncbi:hypothetical protein X743_31650 [Mesorhizobium sp. LNHC252B00]|nr:hypothetical protein X743_31650 [Mesorhizobium sp. LNHC252B00]
MRSVIRLLQMKGFAGLWHARFAGSIQLRVKVAFLEPSSYQAKRYVMAQVAMPIAYIVNFLIPVNPVLYIVCQIRQAFLEYADVEI